MPFHNSFFHILLSFILLLGLGTEGGHAQTADTLAAWKQYQQGLELLHQERKPAAAIPLLEQALMGYQSSSADPFKVRIAWIDAQLSLRDVDLAEDSLKVLLEENEGPASGNRVNSRRGMILRRLASVRYLERDFSKSLELSHAAAELIPPDRSHLREERGELYTLFGNIYFRKGNYLQAGVAFDTAYHCFLDLEPSKDLAGTCNNMGIFHSVMNEHDEALKWYQRASKVYDQVGIDSMGWANLYQNIGIIHAQRQDHQQALSYTLKAARIRMASGGPCSPAYYESVTNLALMMRNLGQLDAAEYYTTKSLVLLDSCDRLPSEGRGEALLKLVSVYEAQGELERAVKTSLEAEAELKRLEGFATTKAVLAIRLGRLYRDLGKLDLAIARYQSVHSIVPSDRSGHQAQLGNAEVGWGVVLGMQGHHQAALEHVQKGLGWLQPNLSPDDIWWESAGPLQMQRGSIRALQARLQILLDWQEKEPERLDLLDKAWETYQSTQALLDTMQRYVVQQKSLLEQRERESETYQLAMEVAYRLYQATGDSEWATRAFLLSEQGKSSLLLLSLRTRRLGQQVEQDQGFLAREDALRRRVSFFQQAIRERGERVDPATLIQWREDQLKADLALEAWKDSLARFYPDYYRIVYQRPSIDPEQVKNYLRGTETAMVEFFVGQSSVYAFWVTADTFLMQRLEISSSEMAVAIQELRSQVETRGNAMLADRAHELYQRLLASGIDDIGSGPSHLLIVPDGWLAYLPFSLLLTEPVDTSRPFAEWPYLMRQSAIGYTHSAQWHLLTAGRDPHPVEGYKAFGPLFEGERSSLAVRDLGESENLWANLARLPGGEREISALSLAFEGESFIGEDVYETVFKSEAGKASVLHLITHGFIDNEAPMGSFLAFSPPQNGSGEDGRLFAWELYDMNLQADLVVLSACNTAVGQLREGEGLMSLARAFHFAGAPSLVATLWSVQDQSTAQLIEQYYPALASGLSKDEALVMSQRTYLEECDPLLAHPYYWAGLVSIGDQQGLRVRGTSGWWYLILLAFVAGGGWLWWHRRAGKQ